jgi:5'-deoxynucleotidase YfbR-like HD superfamily hydrolase
MSADTAAVIALGQLSLAFGRVDRITLHEDGMTPESDTDHTVMLGLIACAFAAKYSAELQLDVGLVAQYALVHDLVEVYAGDTPTLRALSGDAKQAKADREAAAWLRIREEFAALPWLAATIGQYELRRTPEARYVKAMDKLLPKITHILNGCSTIHAEGMSPAALADRYHAQLLELRTYAADFPRLFTLRVELVDHVMYRMRGGAA